MAHHGKSQRDRFPSLISEDHLNELIGLDLRDFASKSQHLKKEKSTQEREIEKLDGKIEDLEKLIDKLGDYEDAQKEVKTLSQQLREQKDRVEENQNSMEQLEPVITSLEHQLKSAEEEAKPLQGVVRQTEELETEIEVAEDELARIGKETAGIEEKIRGSRSNREQLEKDLETKERQLKIKDSLSEHRIWLTDYLAPTIENIEKHVLTSLNQRFNEQFQRWFQILMEDPDLQVRVNEDFSAVIEREGYEQDFLALSGGEKTSVALAYRLALNTMVQEVAAGGGTNVLILDEPTDGFSKEQLSKVRDVLTELKCPQVILVSHERELEAFADRVYRVERVNGVSRVSLLNNR